MGGAISLDAYGCDLLVRARNGTGLPCRMMAASWARATGNNAGRVVIPMPNTWLAGTRSKKNGSGLAEPSPIPYSA